MVLVLVLNISELGEVSNVFLFDFCEPLLDLVDFLVEVLVVLFDAEQFLLPALLLLLVLFLLLLLHLQFLLQLLYLLQLVLLLPVRPPARASKHLLQVLQLLFQYPLLLLLL